MSDAFLSDEESASDGQPREFYDIVQSAQVTYHVASGEQDLTIGGVLYTALPVARTNLGVDVSTGQVVLTLSLPLTHGLCQRWMSQGSPPQNVAVTVWRQQLRSGLVEQQWSGIVSSYSFDSVGHIGKFAIPSRMSTTLARPCPPQVVGQNCPHVLYDRMCRAVAAPVTANQVILSTNGRDIVVSTTGATSLFSDVTMFPFGDLTHVNSGEVQTIIGQAAGGAITLQAPIPEMMPGDAVILRAGCDHSIQTCFTKFANNVNFGGQPFLPTTDLFLPGNGLGIFAS